MHPVLGLESEDGAPEAGHGRSAAGAVLVYVAAPGQEGVEPPEQGLLVTQLAGLVASHSRLKISNVKFQEINEFLAT